MQASNERERLEANQKKIEREIRKHEKELKKKGFLPEEPEAEAAVYPEPKIIDSSAAIPDRSKPSLAEVERKRTRQGTGSGNGRTAYRKL